MNSGESLNSVKIKWYRTVWGVALIGLAVLIVAAFLAYAAFVFNFWREIKAGRGDLLQTRFYPGFSLSGNLAGAGAATVNRAELENGDRPYFGNPAASLVIVEFMDFKCPFCLKFSEVKDELLARYGRDVKIIFRHFPVESLHPGAGQLALVAECAYAQGRFLPVYKWLFDQQANLGAELTTADFKNLTTATGLDLGALNKCLSGPAASDIVNNDFALGIKYGVRGTPTVFVSGERVEGVIPFYVWQGYIEGMSDD